MTDRQLIRLAIDTLTADEFAVWITNRIAGYGRHKGALMLGISVPAWRHRLNNADRKMLAALERKDAA